MGSPSYPKEGCTPEGGREGGREGRLSRRQGREGGREQRLTDEDVAVLLAVHQHVLAVWKGWEGGRGESEGRRGEGMRGWNHVGREGGREGGRGEGGRTCVEIAGRGAPVLLQLGCIRRQALILVHRHPAREKGREGGGR